MGKRSILTAALALAFAATGARAEVYEVTGVVRDLRPETQVAVIQHDDIPDLMPAMTMPFSVRDKADFALLSQDDRVRFELVMDADGSYARAFEVIGKADAAGQARAPSAKAEKLEEGSIAPAFALVDQDGEPTTLRDDRGRYTVLTFIFTRCPVPDFCPLMTRRFGELEAALSEAKLVDRTRLLSITIDPEFDTPEILRQYGESVGADFEHWTFATAEPAVIDQVASAFRVFREKDGARLDHALCTALLAPDGEVLAIWRGNRWTVGEVMESLGKAAHE